MSAQDESVDGTRTGYTSQLDDMGKDAAGLADTAKQDLSRVGDEVKHQVASLKEEAGNQLGEVTEKAKSLAAEQKDLLAGQIGGIVDAIDKVAIELEGSDATSAGYVRTIADGARKLSSTISDNDVDDIISMAQNFGRQQPVAFMGAAALLGFAASRFALASAKRKSPEQQSAAAVEPMSYNYDGGENAGI